MRGSWVGSGQGEAPRKRKKRGALKGEGFGQKQLRTSRHVTSWCGLSEYVVDTGLFMFMFM